MPRASRSFPGGLVYHVLNRGVGRRTLFEKDGDFLAFEKVVEETLRTCRMRICAFCILSNHWHAVVWPESDGDLPAFMQQMTNTHFKRWKEHRHEIGYGHLYQGRYKCFPVETEGYFYQVVRYVERNALRANLVARAEDWPWSSLRRSRTRGPRVSNSRRLATAQTGRLAGTRQPAAIGSRTGRPPTSGSPQLPLRQCSLDGRDCKTTENRINTTFFGKTEEGKMHATRRDIASPNNAYFPNSVAGTLPPSGPSRRLSADGRGSGSASCGCATRDSWPGWICRCSETRQHRGIVRPGRSDACTPTSSQSNRFYLAS